MVKITSQEIEHLAKISRIKIDKQEATQLALEIEAVLDYASSLHTIAQKSTVCQELQKSTNIMRDDIVIQDDREALLDQAPEREGNFFVVPKIIKQ